MDSFILALSVVLPLVVYMAVGGLIRRFSLFTKENFKTLNGLIFKVFIPLALVTLGGILSFRSMMRHRAYLISVSVLHLAVVPLLMVLAGVIFGYRGDVLILILAVFASPTAVASAPMAQTMGGDGDLAGEIVAATSVLCVFTLFLFVFVMSQMGLI